VALRDLNSAFSLSNLGRQQLIRRAIDESFVCGFRWIMAIGAALAAASAVTALFSIGTTRERAGREP
jgi:hypothetical protein